MPASGQDDAHAQILARPAEREALVRWLESHDTSPLTGARLASKDFFPNYALRGLL